MQIANALRFLFSQADPRTDYRVEDDGSGARIAAWNLPDPQPTPAALQAASDAYDAAQLQALADAQALRAQVVSVAQSAVGVVITSLTAVQVRALLAVLLWNAGAIDQTGAIRPLGAWADD